MMSRAVDVGCLQQDIDDLLIYLKDNNNAMLVL